MSGSLLGRGRGGRLAVYGGCGVVIILLVLLYRAATSEMARLRELHVQCAHQQEALAAQLQVIFEYKVRLEKSLAEEKSSNAMVKQELQQRASREKSLRDKNSEEAMQRFNSLQQTYKILQTEHQDLQEECKKREKQALDNANRLETTLQELRSRNKQVQEDKEKAQEDKEKALEHLKTKYLVLSTNNTRLQERYNELLKTTDNMSSTIEHLRKEVFQLNRELEQTKASCKEMPAELRITSKPTQAETRDMEKHGSQSAIEQPLPQEKSQQQPVQDTAASSSIKTMTAEKILSSTRSTGNQSSVDKPLPLPLALPLPVARPASKVKLPIGVVPIPMIRDSKDDRADEASKDKRKPADSGNPESPAAKQRPADQNIEKQENAADWFRVQPGFQEIGDEPNHLGRLAGLDEGGREGEVGDEQYDAIDYYKEPRPKNNDIHIVEAEDEGEDEDDQLDYLNNNPRQNKRE